MNAEGTAPKITAEESSEIEEKPITKGTSISVEKKIDNVDDCTFDNGNVEQFLHKTIERLCTVVDEFSSTNSVTNDKLV